MNPVIGWTLAVLAIAASYQSFGLKGVAFGVTLIVFWLVLQLNRSIRVMKNATDQPIGHIGSAVMFNAKLKPGLSLLQVVAMTKSLGKKVADEPESFAWTDETQSTVTIVLVKGRVASWNLTRPAQADEIAELPPSP
jgi:uncharacterized protein (DUF58 family)